MRAGVWWIAVALVALGTVGAPVGAGPRAALSPALRNQLVSLRDAAMESDYAWRQCEWLCNRIGPRLSGSAEAQAAVRYVADQLKALGLEVRLEPVKVPHWVRRHESGALTRWPGQPEGATRTVALTALGGSVATPPDGLEAEVVVVGSQEALEALPEAQVRGRIVLFDVPFDKRLARMGNGGEAYEQAVGPRVRGAIAAARKGAVASLVRSVGGADYRLPHTGNMRYDAAVPRIPAAAVSAEDAMLIRALCVSGPVRMRLRLDVALLPDVESWNVVADLVGTSHPEEVVIVSGHLDSWDLGTGALDDAAGVAVAMEAAHLVKKLGLRPARTIRVVAWMNEENGLAGGRAYASAHQGELARHYAAVESDLGAGHPSGFSVHGPPLAAALLDPVAGLLEAIGSGVLVHANGSGGADISPLDAAGIPTVGLQQDSRTYFDYHHTAADTLDKIDPQALRENCAVATLVTYALASFEPALSHAKR